MLFSQDRVENGVEIIDEAQDKEAVLEDLFVQELSCWRHSPEHIDSKVVEIVAKRESWLFNQLQLDFVYFSQRNLVE